MEQMSDDGRESDTEKMWEKFDAATVKWDFETGIEVHQ